MKGIQTKGNLDDLGKNLVEWAKNLSPEEKAEMRKKLLEQSGQK